ncbi:unnamed protein product, partial [Durusdinium trenchii]
VAGSGWHQPLEADGGPRGSSEGLGGGLGKAPNSARGAEPSVGNPGHFRGEDFAE